MGFPGGQGSINRINRDGTGQGQVLATGDATHQLAIDSGNQQIYFTRAVSYDNREISHVDTSGANYTVLHSGAGAFTNGWFYSGLALDKANNLLYWGDIGVLTPAPPADGSVNRMTTTGGAITGLTPHVDGRGRGYALDQASQTIFLTSHDTMSPGTGGGVFSYDIANNIETQLISDPTTGYWDIEIDPNGQRIWWTDYRRGQIRSAKFDGSDVQVELSNLTNPYGLALELLTTVQVDLDIKPTSCPNPLNIGGRGNIPVAILGTASFDVTQVDPASILLEGVAPLRFSFEDVATPFAGEKSECSDCTTEGPDGFTDLTLKFDTQDVVAAIAPVSNNECRLLTLTGLLFDGTAIEGQDVVLAKARKLR